MLTIADQRKKHLAFILESLELGGIGKLTLLLAEGFARKGYNVDLVLLKKRGQYLSQVPDQVRVIDLGVKKLIFSMPSLGNYLTANKPDIIISAKERVNIVTLMARRLYRVNCKCFISTHINISQELNHNYGFLFRTVIINLAKFTYKWAGRVVAVSRGVADDLSKVFNVQRSSIEIIYNPLVTEKIYEEMKKMPDHPWLTNKESFVVLSMGRLTRQKDFQTLIKAFYEVKKNYINAKLIILGEGELRQELQKQIEALKLEKDVDLPGYADNPYAYLSRADVFVLSSIWEGFGNVIVEALATGTNVVATDCPSGPGEILGDGEYGYLVPVGDYMKMAEKIEQALEIPFDKELLNLRAKDFSVNRAISLYEKLFQTRGA